MAPIIILLDIKSSSNHKIMVGGQVSISGQCMRNWKIEQVCNNKHINSKYILSTSTLGVSQIEKDIRMFLFIFNLVFFMLVHCVFDHIKKVVCTTE